MNHEESEQTADGRVHALNSNAKARRAEAAAARRQALGYEQTARACRERVAALLLMQNSDELLARCEDNPVQAKLARKDGERARHMAGLLEGEATRHDKEAARAVAEAERAEQEAITAETKAQMHRGLRQ